MISVIAAPADAPQVWSPPSKTTPVAQRLDRLDHRLVTEVQKHGLYGGHVWTVLAAVALEEAAKDRQEQRQVRLALWSRLKRLLRDRVLFLFNRRYVTTKTIHCERRLHRKRSIRTGSAVIPRRDPEAAPLNNHFNLNLLQENARHARKNKTKSATRADISAAARGLARVARAHRRTGHLHGRPARRGQAIRLQDGRQVFLWGCRGHRVVWSLSAKVLLMDVRNPGVEWGVAHEREVSVIKNPAAVTLGTSKRGHSEVFSSAKARSARLNGKRPCRPGRRRGRPLKSPVPLV